MNEIITSCINNLLRMNNKQLIKFARLYDKITFTYDIINIIDESYHSFYIICEEYEQFRVCYQKDDELDIYYFVDYEISYTNLINIIDLYNNDIQIELNHEHMIEDIENIENDDYETELQLDIIDLLQFLLINHDINDINLDCSEFTKERYYNYLDYIKVGNEYIKNN
jgi:hypothetical protein